MVIAVILAGGSGNRFGADKPKQFLSVAGKTILEHSVWAFAKHPLVDEVCVVSREDWVDYVRELLSPIVKVRKVIPGGKERYHSTLAALNCYTNDADNLLFHDAVRPLITEEVITRCIETLQTQEACAVGVPCTDTIWQSTSSAELQNYRTTDRPAIAAIPDRKTLFNAQTPQCFRRSIIRKAYDLALADPEFVSSDDCGVVKHYLLEQPISIVVGDPANIKITYPADLALADKLLS